MTSRKSKELKDFLVSLRKSVKSSLIAAPVWALQKAKKRLWNFKGNRHWKNIKAGKLFRKINKGA